MKLQLFTIHDTKTDVFAPPICQKSQGEAERTFNQMVHDDRTMISKYPEDYDLYHLGSYCDNTGKFELLPAPKHIVKAMFLKTQRNEAVALQS